MWATNNRENLHRRSSPIQSGLRSGTCPWRRIIISVCERVRRSAQKPGIRIVRSNGKTFRRLQMARPPPCARVTKDKILATFITTTVQGQTRPSALAGIISSPPSALSKQELVDQPFPVFLGAVRPGTGPLPRIVISLRMGALRALSNLRKRGHAIIRPVRRDGLNG